MTKSALIFWDCSDMARGLRCLHERDNDEMDPLGACADRSLMTLYLDHDTASALLVRLLKQSGHNVQVPREAGMSGDDDAIHFTHAIREGRVI